MAAHSQAKICIFEVSLHILHSQSLSFCPGHIREVEVLFPADQRFIRSAESHIYCAVLERELDR